MPITTTTEGLQKQDKLIAELESQGGWDIILGDAFVRGMRDIGYKNTPYAMAELVDNAIQADATHIDILFGFDGGLMPKRLAVIDDGYGMKQQMTRAALIWGAGIHADNRGGFGKYGYGLPSASVSQCHRVEVYSKWSGNLWYGAKFPDAPHVFETPESFATLWAGPAQVFLWTDQDDPKELHGKQSFLLARVGGKSILTNRQP